jgi:hypothetical protein
MKLDKHIHRQQAPFSGAVRGTIDRDSISITFANIFSFFLFDFSFASLDFDHPRKKSI